METKGTGTKQEYLRENEQRREELMAKDQGARPSGDLDVDFPLTSPAASQRADRFAQDKEDAFAKPHPVGSNLTTTLVSNEPNPQTPEEFKETGGIKASQTVTEIEPQPSGGTLEAPKTGTEEGQASTTVDQSINGDGTGEANTGNTLTTEDIRKDEGEASDKQRVVAPVFVDSPNAPKADSSSTNKSSGVDNS